MINSIVQNNPIVGMYASAILAGTTKSLADGFVSLETGGALSAASIFIYCLQIYLKSVKDKNKDAKESENKAETAKNEVIKLQAKHILDLQEENKELQSNQNEFINKLLEAQTKGKNK